MNQSALIQSLLVAELSHFSFFEQLHQIGMEPPDGVPVSLLPVVAQLVLGDAASVPEEWWEVQRFFLHQSIRGQPADDLAAQFCEELNQVEMSSAA